MTPKKNVGVNRDERHAYFARQALATVHFKARIDRAKSFQSIGKWLHQKEFRAKGKWSQAPTVENLVRIAASCAAVIIPKATAIWDGLAGDHAARKSLGRCAPR